MKHIALRSKSVRSGDRPYTCPGLGDRIHSILMARQYGISHNTPVTVHITDDKWSVANGKKSDKKKKSWKEIIDLFPENTVYIKPWPVENLYENEWLGFLKEQGIEAEIYYYKDTAYMHPNENKTSLEMSQYLKKPLLMKPKNVSLDLPKKFITVQWDSTDVGRNISDILLKGIYSKYNCEHIHVGGQSKNDYLKNSLAHIGYAMSKAEYHVGVDSGMLHVAQLYLHHEKIHIYNKVNGYKSHHLVRAEMNGSKVFRI